MSKKHSVADDVKGNTCKAIYKRYMSILETANVDMKKLEEIMCSDDYNEAMMLFAKLVAQKDSAQLMAEFSDMSGNSFLNNIFDLIWFYRRNLHFRIDSIPDVDVYNTSILSENTRDMCLDIQHNNKTFAVYVFHRDYPIKLRKDVLDWTAQVFAYTPSTWADKKRLAVRAMTNPAYTIHFSASENTRRCYIEHNDVYETDCAKVCKHCNKCSEIQFVYGVTSVKLRLFPLKYRIENGCTFSTFNIAGHDIYEVISPIDVIKCVIHAIDCYNSREVITRKNGKKARAYNACKVHIASETSNADKIVMLPLHEYVKEYKASHPYEYKGGHHASLVAHTRRGYYRKARKHGDYIRKGEQFIYVGKGEGDYCFVRATHVNSKTDRVVIYQTASTDNTQM